MPQSPRWFRFPFVLLALIVLSGCVTGPPRREFSGRVVRILDGDTIEVLYQLKPQRIRLGGVDCPERRQAFGTVARQFTAEHAFGRTVTVKVHDTDRYGRTVGEVILPDGDSLNYELVRAGLAWWYRQYARKDMRLAEAEAEARDAGRGLWADPHAKAPWDFRRQGRKARAR